MHPQMTTIQAEAPGVFAHIFASAGALVFVNDYAGAAATPAPDHAFADHQRACPVTPRYPTLGEPTGSPKRPKNLRPASASTGPMPNRIFADTLRAPSTESTAGSRTHPKPVMRGGVPC